LEGYAVIEMCGYEWGDVVEEFTDGVPEVPRFGGQGEEGGENVWEEEGVRHAC
jgi:hypothetical protein